MVTDPATRGQDSHSPRTFSRLLGGVLSLAKSWVGLLAAYFAAVAGVFASYKNLQNDFKHLDWRIQAVILGFLPVCALVFQGIPDLRDWLKRRRLLEVIGPASGGYFQLAPREAGDICERSDGAHEEVLFWVLGSTETVLYLTGLSGSGKSSILSVHVIPALQRKSAKIIRLRGYQDPITLRHELIKPGAIWKKPAGETRDLELPEVLRRACEYLNPAPLYIIIDQFEEFVILQDEESQARFRSFVQELLHDPPEGLTLLFSFRSDYISLIEKLGLPLLLQRTNWKEVPPFTEAQAREYVQKSGLQVEEDFLRRVLREAAEIEHTRGFIRPVTINLCGLVLARFVGGPPQGYRPGGLVRGFLQESLRMEGVLEAGPAVIGQLISSHLTKKPKRIDVIAASTGLTRELVRGCLRRLGAPDRAIVRPLDYAEETWEISHDFLVPLLDSVIARWRLSLWRKARPWLPWVAATASILAAIGLNYRQYPHQPDPIGELAHLGWINREPKPKSFGQPAIPRVLIYDVPGTDPPSESVKALNRIKGPLKVTIKFCSDTSVLPGWVGDGKSPIWLTIATATSCEGPREATIVSPLHINLTGLVLQANVHDIELLRNFAALTELDLSDTNVSNLDPLTNLKALTKLSLPRYEISNLEPLRNLTALTELDLKDNKVSSFDPLRNLTALTNLDLSHTNISNFDQIKYLASLESLYLDCTEVGSLEGLENLYKLRALSLRGNLKIRSIAPLVHLPILTFVYLDPKLNVDLTPLQKRNGIAVQQEEPVVPCDYHQ